MIDPEDDGCGYADCGHEGVGAAIIACVDAAPVLEFAEHVLDLMALTIEHFVMRDMDFAIGL